MSNLYLFYAVHVVKDQALRRLAAEELHDRVHRRAALGKQGFGEGGDLLLLGGAVAGLRFPQLYNISRGKVKGGFVQTGGNSLSGR